MNRFTKTELMEMKFDYDEYFRPKWVREAGTEAVKCVEERYATKKPHPTCSTWLCDYCVLCAKWDDSNHRNSNEHRTRVNETAEGDVMLGMATSSRRFTQNVCGLPDYVTKRGMKLFWGNKVENMPSLLWDRMRQHTTFEVQIPGWGKQRRTLKYSDLSDIRLCSVTYAGTGRYNPYSDFAVRWEDTPDEQDDGLDRLIDPQKEYKAPLGKGFWPVCWVSWRTEAYDVGFRGTMEEYHAAQVAGRIVIWVICWYQLFENVWVLVLWPVSLRSRL